MPERPRMTLTSTVLGTPDPRGLARFYAALLGWPIETDEPEWVTLRPGGPGLSFQLEADHVPPTWPQGPGDQQMQLHLDVRVGVRLRGEKRVAALEAEAARLVALGGRRVRLLAADEENEACLVMQDVEGNEFCLD